MKVALCLDDRGGMMFNHRRQSRDRRVMEDLASCSEGRLWCSPYSEKLLREAGLDCVASETFLARASEGETCFLEDRPLGDAWGRVGTLVIYRWNRHYPADLYLDGDPATRGFRLTETTEFEGYSHEKITKEVWKR